MICFCWFCREFALIGFVSLSRRLKQMELEGGFLELGLLCAV